MTDKEVEIIDGVIKGILAFLSNPKNEEITTEYLEYYHAGLMDYAIKGLWTDMDAELWLHTKYDGYFEISLTYYMCNDIPLWQQCVDHALMILSMEYQYER